MERERPYGGWLGFEVSHPSDKNKDVRWMGHPQFHLPWAGFASGGLIQSPKINTPDRVFPQHEKPVFILLTILPGMRPRPAAWMNFSTGCEDVPFKAGLSDCI